MAVEDVLERVQSLVDAVNVSSGVDDLIFAMGLIQVAEDELAILRRDILETIRDEQASEEIPELCKPGN